MPALDRKHNLR